MSRRVNPKTVKAGDRVRVGREHCEEFGYAMHGIKFGAVCTVRQVEGTGFLGNDVPQILVSGPHNNDHEFSGDQWVDVASCKVAK